MECGAMRIAGMGFRKTAGIDSLRSALLAAGGTDGVVALATAADKAEARALIALAAELRLRICAIAPTALAAVETQTRSDRVAARFGTGSLAEAAALAAAGAGARLLGPRAVSADGMATAAIAEGIEQ
jgi:cobalt-precorrin 5A hydrolase